MANFRRSVNQLAYDNSNDSDSTESNEESARRRFFQPIIAQTIHAQPRTPEPCLKPLQSSPPTRPSIANSQPRATFSFQQALQHDFHPVQSFLPMQTFQPSFFERYPERSQSERESQYSPSLASERVPEGNNNIRS